LGLFSFGFSNDNLSWSYNYRKESAIGLSANELGIPIRWVESQDLGVYSVCVFASAGTMQCASIQHKRLQRENTMCSLLHFGQAEAPVTITSVMAQN
jgi:hypothetical protein